MDVATLTSHGNRVIVAGIGRTVAYFTYDTNTLDFSCQSFSFVRSFGEVEIKAYFLDVFYDFLVWTSIEPCLGVLGCCLPTMGPLLPLIDLRYTKIYSKIKSTFSRQSLADKSKSTSSQNLSGQRTAWVELKSKKDGTSEETQRYEGPSEIESRSQRSYENVWCGKEGRGSMWTKLRIWVVGNCERLLGLGFFFSWMTFSFF
jgi:hypothetical protein